MPLLPYIWQTGAMMSSYWWKRLTDYTALRHLPKYIQYIHFRLRRMDGWNIAAVVSCCNPVLRIQVRSIATLAQVAEDFGKGINTPFKPYGSSEVRKAGIAFIKMKERIQKQISERTQMLAGVSHDLRTPLTRMKLQLAMLPESPDNKEFIDDIGEMEKMLDGYLAFVSGEGGEKIRLLI